LPCRRRYAGVKGKTLAKILVFNLGALVVIEVLLARYYAETEAE
jgi:hypothetical protein